jgi:TonB family protein
MVLAVAFASVLAQATPSSSLRPTPTGTACPDTPVTVKKGAPNSSGDITPMLMKIAPAQGFVYITVTVNPDGSIKDASIKESSGTAQLDALGLKWANETTYNPRIVNCTAVVGEFVYVLGWMR